MSKRDKKIRKGDGAVRELHSRTKEKGDCPIGTHQGIPRNAACAEGLRHPELVFPKGSIRAGAHGVHTSGFNETMSKWIPTGKRDTNDTLSESVIPNLFRNLIERWLPMFHGTLKQVQGDVIFKALSVFLFLLLTLSTTAQTLPDYLQTAGENNPTLQSKYKAYEAALQKVPQVSTLPDPQFSFGYFLRPVETRVGPQRAKFSLSQMFPWFGTLDARESVAAQYAEVKFQQFIDARNELFLKVKKQYYDIYELKEQIGIMEENIELLNSYENLARTRYQNNQTKMVDVIRVQMRKDDVQTRLGILEDKLRPMVAEFNALLHRQPQAEVMVADTLTSMQTDTMTIQQDAVSNNPKLTAIQHKKAAAQKEERAAVKNGMPKLGLGLDYVLVDERTDMTLPDNGKNVVMPMVSATIPIFRKKYRAQKKEAVLKQEQFELERTGKEEELMADFEMKTYQLEQAGENVRLYQRLTERATQALNILTVSYSTGEEDFEEILRMEEELLQYRLQLLKALADQHKHKAEIDYLTGKDL